MKRNLLFIVGFILALVTSHPVVFAQTTDAMLEFKPSVTEAKIGDEFDVDIILKNPNQQNIISVRAWLEYNTSALEGVSINADTDTSTTPPTPSPFTLSAPGENEFSAGEGYVKIGRSNIAGGFTGTEAKVATVRFKVKTPYDMTTLIEAYDYQVTELGHTSVNIVNAGFPINILNKEPEKASVHLNPGGPVQGSGSETTTEVILPSDAGGVGLSNLNRPQNLRVNTGSGYVDLRWDESKEPELMGYNIYYGKTSGQYTRRRTLPNINEYRLDGLNNNEVYYFALTAYDDLNRESDYSDEVGIIINQPLSSTSPFEEILAALMAKIPIQPQNGPLIGWLAFSAMGLGGAFVFRKRRLQ